MPRLAQRVLAYIHRERLLKAGDRVGVAVSAGADSVALLRLFLELRKELGVVLSVVHFNHKLRGRESDADEDFVCELAREQKLAMYVENGDVTTFAAEKKMSLEAAARELRYQYFCRLLQEHMLDRIATAHTLDDQAETVLLRVARGSGTRGLAGIYPRVWVGRSPAEGVQFASGAKETQLSASSSQFSVLRSEDRRPSIIRPLLGVRRRELEEYLAGLGQSWREDKSNRDLRHARNRVRHGILPRLERNLNPAVRDTLAETAEIARGEEDYWQKEVARVLPRAIRDQRCSEMTLSLEELALLPLALQRRVVREMAELVGLRLEFRQVEEVLDLGLSEKPPTNVQLPDEWIASRKRDEIRWARRLPLRAQDYDYLLGVPGRVEVAETGTAFEAVVVSDGEAEGYNARHLFDPALLSQDLHVRNWRAGDHFWLPHTKGPKKIKELLQERHVVGEERKLWPVVLSGDEVVWVRGFPAHARLRAPENWKRAIVIRESPLVAVQG
ncbi:MAG TPA: tRNA lysidine(34) synthetase TilS [Terriglobales bacterium]|nr:tRNA lysidine(34) synthetase TilS [Terriglobales bacterium]